MRKTNTTEHTSTIAPHSTTAEVAQGIESYEVQTYDVSHIATESLAQIVASSMGDRRLFESHLLLQRYADNFRTGMVGNQYYAWVSTSLEADIVYRREQLEAIGAFVLEANPVPVAA